MKSIFTLVIWSLLLFLFQLIYQMFSYGERSPYMQWVFVLPLLVAVIHVLTYFGRSWLTSAWSQRFLHSSLAIAVSGCLIKGIIELSGRHTRAEVPYWWAGLFFLGLSLWSGLRRKGSSPNS